MRSSASTNDIKESDWKVFRRLHSIALERYCQRVLAEVKHATTCNDSYHDCYLKLFRLLRDRDKTLARCFNDLRRSTALLQLLIIIEEGLLTGYLTECGYTPPQISTALYRLRTHADNYGRTPYGQSRVSLSFVLRLTQAPASVVPAIRRAMAEVDASLPLSQMQMLQDALDRQVDTPRDSMVFVGVFGAIALLLASLGIYGIVAYGVVQRTHEIGVRMALGARRSSVLGLVLRQSTMLTVAGLVIGIGAAAMLTTYLQTLLFNLTPLDATTFAAVPVLFALTAALAAYLPARRATRLDPQAVLRHD